MERAGLVLLVLAGCASSPPPPPARVEPAPPPPARSAEMPASLPEDLPPYEPPLDEPPPPYVSAPPPTSAPAPTVTPAEEKACAARGGKIQPVCMLGTLECVLRFRDGGKRCTDKRDCAGQCLYEGPHPAPTQAVGACQRTSDPCGCKAPIVNGSVRPAFCVD